MICLYIDLDAGHGGSDSGAVAYGYKEVLLVVLAVELLLNVSV